MKKEETKPTVAVQQEEQKQPWHAPTLRRADNNFDTANTKGSGIDGGSASAN